MERREELGGGSYGGRQCRVENLFGRPRRRTRILNVSAGQRDASISDVGQEIVCKVKFVAGERLECLRRGRSVGLCWSIREMRSGTTVERLVVARAGMGNSELAESERVVCKGAVAPRRRVKRRGHRNVAECDIVRNLSLENLVSTNVKGVCSENVHYHHCNVPYGENRAILRQLGYHRI